MSTASKTSDQLGSLLKGCLQLLVVIALLVYTLVVIIQQRDKVHSDCESKYHVYVLVVSLFVVNVLAMVLFPFSVLFFPQHRSFKAFLRSLLPAFSSQNKTNPALCSCWKSWAFLSGIFWYFVLQPALSFWAVTVLAQLGHDSECRSFFDADLVCSSSPVGFVRTLCELSRLRGQLIFQVVFGLLPFALLVGVGVVCIVGLCYGLATARRSNRMRKRTSVNEETALLATSAV
ncbi:hypothetical protein QOT17_021446 [Balamuthia mandrillaris]